MEQKLNTSGRIYDLDVLRTLACCAVVMIHASAQYASNDVGTLNFFIGNFWDSLSRFAVPVFVRSFFSGSFHLWFCYMIVGLYLILPLLRLWVKRENVRQVRWLSITNAAQAIPFLFVTTFGVSWALSALLGRIRWTRPFVE